MEGSNYKRDGEGEKKRELIEMKEGVIEIKKREEKRTEEDE